MCKPTNYLWCSYTLKGFMFIDCQFIIEDNVIEPTVTTYNVSKFQQLLLHCFDRVTGNKHTQSVCSTLYDVTCEKGPHGGFEVKNTMISTKL